MIHRLSRGPGRLDFVQALVIFWGFLALPFVRGQSVDAPAQTYYINCSVSVNGDGSRAHPWKSPAAAEKHRFAPGDRIELARGSVCHGAFAPQGSGAEGRVIHLTSYGKGPRPRLVAPPSARQAFLLNNQEYWQIDSLDISGGNTYGVFITADKGPIHHIYLKNLYIHDVFGGEMKSKDNGLVVIGPSARGATFDDVLVDGVTAAHTNQWAGILIGGGDFGMDMPLNRHVVVRNSSVHDVYGDGIVLFRDSDSVIENSVAWETGMQPTQTIGTPNAIWTWTCTNCTVRNNEAFLTDSPGGDGGAYDIDWNNTGNVVEGNYAHDTQGYCIAVFAAGYVTRDSVVRNNVCTDNALSPRLAALQGAVYLHTWNGGVIHGLDFENNSIIWNPSVASAPAIVDDADCGDTTMTFTGNRILSTATHFYRANAQFAPAKNTYTFSGAGEARFSLGDKRDATLTTLQAAGLERGSTLVNKSVVRPTEIALRLDATVNQTLDADGLLAPGPRTQLMVLRSLSDQYADGSLLVTVHLVEPSSPSAAESADLDNALLDLDASHIHFLHDGQRSGVIRLAARDGRLLEEWHGRQSAATLGGAVRARLGAPRFAAMESSSVEEQR